MGMGWVSWCWGLQALLEVSWLGASRGCVSGAADVEEVQFRELLG